MTDAESIDTLAHTILGPFAAGGMDLKQVGEVFDHIEALRPGLTGPMLFVAAIRHGADALRRLALATDQDIFDLVEHDETKLNFDWITRTLNGNDDS